MLFTMKLRESPFDLIRSGSKTVELRLYDEKRQRINAGDEIVFSRLPDENETLTVTVKALHRYDSFLELFKEIPPVNCGYEEGVTAEEAASGMREYYSESDEKRYGVLGIEVEIKEFNQ